MKISKKYLIALACTSVISFYSFTASADTEDNNRFMGNIAITSTYLWRGLAQTQNAAVQGGVSYSDPTGFFFNGWASTVDNGSELDINLAYKNTVGTFEYDFGGLFYIFPQSSGNNDSELYLGMQMGAFGLKFSAALDRGEYLETDFSLPLESWLMKIHLGFNRIKSGEDYFDFNLGFDKKLRNFNMGFLVSDTNLSGEDFRVIVHASKDFAL